jgi:lipoyl-dependent peroxiredoxin
MRQDGHRQEPRPLKEEAAMAATRTASTHWEGNLFQGAGRVTFESSDLGTHDVTWAARTEDPGGRTSPEELIAAALSSCYCMAFSNVLDKAGTPPTALDVQAAATFQPGEGVTGIHLVVKGTVPGMSEEDFAAAAQTAHENCPVSQALRATPITLDAALS